MREHEVEHIPLEQQQCGHSVTEQALLWVLMNDREIGAEEISAGVMS